MILLPELKLRAWLEGLGILFGERERLPIQLFFLKALHTAGGCPLSTRFRGAAGAEVTVGFLRAVRKGFEALQCKYPVHRFVVSFL